MYDGQKWKEQGASSVIFAANGYTGRVICEAGALSSTVLVKRSVGMQYVFLQEDGLLKTVGQAPGAGVK